MYANRTLTCKYGCASFFSTGLVVSGIKYYLSREGLYTASLTSQLMLIAKYDDLYPRKFQPNSPASIFLSIYDIRLKILCAMSLEGKGSLVQPQNKVCQGFKCRRNILSVKSNCIFRKEDQNFVFKHCICQYYNVQDKKKFIGAIPQMNTITTWII